MRIKQLDYIVKIVELGSVNEAAKHLFITQPSLSNAVKELEQEMGIQIFQRTQKGMVLTTEGTEFLAYARQILEQVDLLEENTKEQTNGDDYFLFLPSIMLLQFMHSFS